MPIYRYKAFNSSGKQIENYIESSSLSAAQANLKQQGYYIREIREDIIKRDRELFPELSKLLYRVSGKDMGLFSRQLGTLLGAGITLNQALTDVWEQTSNQHFKKIISQMKQDVVSGKSLSEAIAAHKDIFPPVYENMVKVGEATGSYESTLNSLAELEEKNAELKGKAITALVYPGIMLFVSFAVVIFLLTSVVPQIETMFAQFEGAELPLPTRIVLGISSFVRNYWYLAILGAGASLLLLGRWKSTTDGKLKWNRFVFKIPLLGKIQLKITVSRFARNLGILLERNVSLLVALSIVSGVVDSAILKKELEQAIKEIKEGISLKNALQKSEVLPQMTKGMMAAGEATDQMSKMLLKVATIMEAEVDSAVKGLTAALEPIMIVVMGGLVGGIMIAVMMPLYKLAELIK